MSGSVATIPPKRTTMPAAALGLELPCRRAVPPHATVLLCHNQRPILQARPRPGRLLPRRPLRRALRALLQQCEQRVRQQLQALAHNRRAEADDLVRRFRLWQQRMIKRHLAPRRLRLDPTERFAAWQLPACAWRHMAKQLAQPLSRTPLADRLTLHCRIPITPCMRLGDGGPDHITAYLHAPGRFLNGPWVTVPPDRVRVGYAGDCVEVVVE